MHAVAKDQPRSRGGPRALAKIGKVFVGQPAIYKPDPEVSALATPPIPLTRHSLLSHRTTHSMVVCASSTWPGCTGCSTLLRSLMLMELNDYRHVISSLASRMLPELGAVMLRASGRRKGCHGRADLSISLLTMSSSSPATL